MIKSRQPVKIYRCLYLSWYKLNGSSPNSPADPINDLLNALSNGIAGVASGKASSSQLLGSSILSSDITDFLGDHSYTGGKPKAYLNWMFFDEQFKYDSASSGFEQVGADTILTPHTHYDLPAGKNGYLYIYVSNLTPNINVFFDNLQVTHTRGPLIEETHYYPFGLTMAGISSQALNFGGPSNKKKFNGYEQQNKEFSDGSGLEWYDYKHRFYDNQIGRFFCVDRITDQYPYYSPYEFAGNRVTIAVDLDGDEPKYMIDGNGNLTNPLKQLLYTAYGGATSYWSLNLLNRSKWVKTQSLSGSNTMAYSQKIRNNTVKWNPDIESLLSSLSEKDRFEQWFALITHEEYHRAEKNWSFFSKIVTAFHDIFSSYENRWIEESAYSYGGGILGSTNNSAGRLLSTYGNQIFNILTNEKLSESEKNRQLSIIGYEFRKSEAENDIKKE